MIKRKVVERGWCLMSIQLKFECLKKNKKKESM